MKFRRQNKVWLITRYNDNTIKRQLVDIKQIPVMSMYMGLEKDGKPYYIVRGGDNV